MRWPTLIALVLVAAARPAGAPPARTADGLQPADPRRARGRRLHGPALALSAAACQA